MTSTVAVRGFDFGTTEDQIFNHMSTCGTILSVVQSSDRGSAEVTYSSPDEATYAMEQMQKTTIIGNRRYIDVLPVAKRFSSADGEPPAKRFNAGGQGGGTSIVVVKGFDFGTTEDQVFNHMSTVGTVLTVKADKGSAEVTYSSPSEATVAMEQLNKTTIFGNNRYIDVLPARSCDVAGGGGTCTVVVKGFDFETTNDQVFNHMSTVGTIVNVVKSDKGSAEVTYSSANEASAAMAQLSKTTIEGNRRYIDVIPAANRANSGWNGGGQGGGNHGGMEMTQMMQKGGGKGGGNQMTQMMQKGDGKGGGNQMMQMMEMMSQMKKMTEMFEGMKSMMGGFS